MLGLAIVSPKGTQAAEAVRRPNRAHRSSGPVRPGELDTALRRRPEHPSGLMRPFIYGSFLFLVGPHFWSKCQLHYPAA